MEKKPLVSVIIVTYNRKEEVIGCIDSVLNSAYSPIEIVVVDNASIDGTSEALQNRFADRIVLSINKENIYAGGGRNIGAKLAKGAYLLFIDSDNIIDPNMINNLIKGILENRELQVGLSGPFTYYKSDKKRLCWVNSHINMVTSRTMFTGVGQLDYGQYDNTKYIKVGHIPNIFMLERAVFERVGGIDSDYVMHYEESDLAEKLIKLGLSIVLFPQAKAWHNLPLRSPKGHKSFLGNNYGMVYYVSRNRIIFMRKNSGGIRLLLFILIFSNIFLFFNLSVIVLNKRLDLIKPLFKGYFDGLTNKILFYEDNIYKPLD